MGVVLLAAVAMAASGPRVAPLSVPGDARAVCPTAEVEAAHGALFEAKGVEVGPKHREFDRAVARWAACARLMGVESYGLPKVEDAAAARVVTAALTQPGRRERVEALEAAAADLPEAVAVLALEELEILALLQRAEPSTRLTLAAAAVGAWGCPHARDWGLASDGLETAWCTDGRDLHTMAREGVARLLVLAGPTRDMSGWLGLATAARADGIWSTVSETWFPLVEPLPIPLAVGGVGMPLDPDLGWSGRIGRDLAIWMPRPKFRFTTAGYDVAKAQLLTRPPRDWDGVPVVYVERGTTVGRIAEVLVEHNVGRPRLVARADGAVIELRLAWAPPGVKPPADALVLDVGPDPVPAELVARVRASDAPGALWLRAEPSVLFEELVAVQGAVGAVRDGPIRLTVQED